MTAEQQTAGEDAFSFPLNKLRNRLNLAAAVILVAFMRLISFATKVYDLVAVPDLPAVYDIGTFVTPLFVKAPKAPEETVQFHAAYRCN